MATTEELRQYMERLEDRIRELEQRKDPEKVLAMQKFEDIKFYPQLKVRTLILKFIRQATKPVPLANEIVLWQDSDDDATYLTVNFNGTVNSVALT